MSLFKITAAGEESDGSGADEDEDEDVELPVERESRRLEEEQEAEAYVTLIFFPKTQDIFFFSLMVLISLILSLLFNADAWQTWK